MTTPFCTAEDVRGFLGMEDAADEAQEASIDSLILAATASIEKLTGPILAARYNEVRDGQGGRILFPRQRPLRNIISLTIDGRRIDGHTAAKPGYLFDEVGIRLAGDLRFTQGFGNVDLTYAAGYVDVPADIKSACIELAALRLRSSSRAGVRSKSLAGESITYADTEMPPRIKSMLDPYDSVAAP